MMTQREEEKLKNLIDRVISTLNEFGIDVYEHHPIEDESDEYVLLAENMIIVYDPPVREIKISFLVSTLPQDAARLTLILRTVKGVKKVTIMEPFIFNEEGKVLSGDSAIELFEKTKKSEIIKNFVKEQEHMYILHTHESGMVH